MVAPYSGAMLAMVARSGSVRRPIAGPQNSTTAASTSASRKKRVSASTTSVHITPGRGAPTRRQPTTRGTGSPIGWPNITVAASMPPTPQPNTPSALTIGVWLSMPTRLSGKASRRPSRSALATTSAKRSILTRCTMPVLPGVHHTKVLLNCAIAQRTAPVALRDCASSSASRLRCATRRARCVDAHQVGRPRDRLGIWLTGCCADRVRAATIARGCVVWLPISSSTPE